jgi:predicted PurR-regulated permease PerM
MMLLGHGYAALFLAIWSTVVVGLSDNILRPMLAKGGTHLHGAVVLFSILGSIAYFGAIGIILGPLTLSAFLTMLDLWKRESRATG